MSVWGAIGSAAIQAASAYAANQANIKNQNQLWSDQVNLANTGHQREVQDLRLAGLNPILSAMGSSGNATPSPTAATQQSIGEGVGSAFAQMLQLRNQTTMADAAKTNAETNAWQVYDAKQMDRAGFEVMGYGTGAKSETVQTIRVNKVTGACYTLDGRRVKVLDAPDINSGKQPTVYVYPSEPAPKKSVGQHMDETYRRAYDSQYRNPNIFRKD